MIKSWIDTSTLSFSVSKCFQTHFPRSKLMGSQFYKGNSIPQLWTYIVNKSLTSNYWNNPLAPLKFCQFGNPWKFVPTIQEFVADILNQWKEKICNFNTFFFHRNLGINPSRLIHQLYTTPGALTWSKYLTGSLSWSNGNPPKTCCTERLVP